MLQSIIPKKGKKNLKDLLANYIHRSLVLEEREEICIALHIFVNLPTRRFCLLCDFTGSF